MSSSYVLLLILLYTFTTSSVGAQAAGLEKGFYKKSCPQAEQTVQSIVWDRVASNGELPAKFLRMFFHDCFVRVRCNYMSGIELVTFQR